MRSIRQRLDRLTRQAAVANEAALVGICIVDDDGEIVSGRPNPHGVTIYLPMKDEPAGVLLDQGEALP